jgi:hypothetical protein
MNVLSRGRSRRRAPRQGLLWVVAAASVALLGLAFVLVR